MTNNIDRPDDERSQESFEIVQGATEDALRAGRKYLSENPIPIILGTLIVGAILGFLLRPTPPKPPDPAQAVREWFEKVDRQIARHQEANALNSGRLGRSGRGSPEKVALLVSLTTAIIPGQPTPSSVLRAISLRQRRCL